MANGPLRDIRIVEIAGLGPTPFTAMILADMGAEVLRIERPGNRHLLGLDYDILNRGRGYLEADLKNGSDVEAVKTLIENADGLPTDLQRFELDFVQKMNRRQLRGDRTDADLEARINSFELAFRMQARAPELQSIDGETKETLATYGLDQDTTKNYGRQCLMARRFIEQGVRFVQCTHSYKWDQHGDLRNAHARNAMEVDQPIAALLADLKERGLLEDTLVLWGGEFGRTPVAQGDNGRDHNPQAYTMWLAGGGFQGGIQYGKTDEYGYYSVEDKVHVHDLHATMLHQFGLDHTKLTYRYAGRDFRLTDIHGEIVHDILA